MGMRSLVIVSTLVLVACGSTPADERDASVDATTTDTSSEPITFGDVALPDTYLGDAASIALDAGGPFLCFGCVCNGADHFCLAVASGDHTAPLSIDGGFGDAAACEPDAGYAGCVPIPSQCMAEPSCACVLADVGGPCTCMIDGTGAGLDVGCALP